MTYNKRLSLLEKLKIKSVLLEGEALPVYHGLAYRDWYTDVRVGYILPFNWIVRAWRELMAYLRFPNYPNAMDGRLGKYQEGLIRKWRHKFRDEGYAACIYNLTGRFNRTEMEALELMMDSSDVPEFYRRVLSDIHHNYMWLHEENKKLK